MGTEDSKKSELHLGAETNLQVMSTKIIATTDTLTLFSSNGNVCQLTVRVHADLSKIPEEYHRSFVNMFSAKYLGRISHSEDILSYHDGTQKKKWYEFWKTVK